MMQYNICAVTWMLKLVVMQTLADYQLLPSELIMLFSTGLPSESWLRSQAKW